MESGCKIQMTPNMDDFVNKVSPYQTVVDTASGGIAEVTRKGINGPIQTALIDGRAQSKKRNVSGITKSGDTK
jgi:hypothetical protein